MRTMEFNIKANEVLRWQVAGAYLCVDYCENPVNIEFYKNGVIVGFLENVGASVYQKGKDFDEFLVRSVTAQKVKIYVGGGEAGANRVAGMVEVVNSRDAAVSRSETFVIYNADSFNLTMNEPAFLVLIRNNGDKKVIVDSSYVLAATASADKAVVLLGYVKKNSEGLTGNYYPPLIYKDGKLKDIVGGDVLAYRYNVNALEVDGIISSIGDNGYMPLGRRNSGEGVCLGVDSYVSEVMIEAGSTGYFIFQRVASADRTNTFTLRYTLRGRII